jgi:CO/xanthine dehydrogenase Mo-binding subunit
MDRIVFLNTNTNRVPDSGPTVASRGTIMGGSAAKAAAEQVRDTLLAAAAQLVGVDAADLHFSNGRLLHRGTGEALASFSEVAEACFAQGRPMFALGWHKAPATSWNEQSGQGEAYFTFVYGANVAEVEVDTETGKVNVTGFTAVHDVGKAIALGGVLGQIFGGVAMGLGYGLLEEFIQHHAVPQQLNFDEYLLPTSKDVPPVKAFIVENPDAAGPFGAKSVGEPANEIAAPAITNAVSNATGTRLFQIPATLERVLLGHELRREGPRGSVAVEEPTGS